MTKKKAIFTKISTNPTFIRSSFFFCYNSKIFFSKIKAVGNLTISCEKFHFDIYYFSKYEKSFTNLVLRY